jgi:hypothetical protein
MWMYVILVVVITQIYGFVVLILVNEGHDNMVKALCALVYFPLCVLTYPIRKWWAYTAGSAFYAKSGITRWQYLLGKRVKER